MVTGLDLAGVRAGSVPREVVDEAVAITGKGAQRSGGKLPPHVMMYLAMALALFADDDYEEAAVRLTETLEGWGAGIGSGRRRLRAGSPRRGSGWVWRRWSRCSTTGTAKSVGLAFRLVEVVGV